MEYNKEENEFFHINYSSKVIFYEKEEFDSSYDNFLKINLSNETLRSLILEKYKLKALPSILYYGSILEINENTKNRIKEIDTNKEEILRKNVSDIISSNKIVMFIKGSLRSQYCQFSKELVKITKSYVSDINNITYYDVLMNEEMRQYIKIFSNWPTFPQLYVNREFIGGIDIVKSLDKAGVLCDKFSEDKYSD